MLAKDIMTRDVITVGPKATVREIAEILVEHKISGLPVVDGEGRVLGLVSEGDLMHKEIAPKLPDALSILGAIIYYSGLKEYQEAFRKMAASTAEEIMTAKVIADRLGHSTTKTTLDTYSHVFAASEVKAMQAVEMALFKQEE